MRSTGTIFETRGEQLDDEGTNALLEQEAELGMLERNLEKLNYRTHPVTHTVGFWESEMGYLGRNNDSKTEVMFSSFLTLQ